MSTAPALGVPARLAAAAGIGLAVGLAFALPACCYLYSAAGGRRTILLLLAAAVAILVIRRCSAVLGRLLETTPQGWRLTVLGLYGLVAMAVPASLLL